MGSLLGSVLFRAKTEPLAAPQTKLARPDSPGTFLLVRVTKFSVERGQRYPSVHGGPVLALFLLRIGLLSDTS